MVVPVNATDPHFRFSAVVGSRKVDHAEFEGAPNLFGVDLALGPVIESAHLELGYRQYEPSKDGSARLAEFLLGLRWYPVDSDQVLPYISLGVASVDAIGTLSAPRDSAQGMYFRGGVEWAATTSLIVALDLRALAVDGLDSYGAGVDWFLDAAILVGFRL
jgi:hypothetical protein